MQLKRGAYVLPSLFTMGNMLCGFYCVILALNKNFAEAGIFVLVAAFFDALDGRVARLTGTTSRFGIEFDSLADIISFGMAPALLVYLYNSYVGWLAPGTAGFWCALYLVTGGLRLARFNARAEEKPSDFFVGLPIPAASGVVISTVMVDVVYQWGLPGYFYIVMLMIVSYLMISTIPYPTGKKYDFRRRTPTRLIWFGFIFFFILIKWFYWTMFAMSIGYLLIGIYLAIYRRLRLISLRHRHEEIINKRSPQPPVN